MNAAQLKQQEPKEQSQQDENNNNIKKDGQTLHSETPLSGSAHLKDIIQSFSSASSLKDIAGILSKEVREHPFASAYIAFQLGLGLSTLKGGALKKGTSKVFKKIMG